MLLPLHRRFDSGSVKHSIPYNNNIYVIIFLLIQFWYINSMIILQTIPIDFHVVTFLHKYCSGLFEGGTSVSYIFLFISYYSFVISVAEET